ncbi:hypothetical protein P7C73_g5964, partial [Tremellales sp. Uapishka_1]
AHPRPPPPGRSKRQSYIAGQLDVPSTGAAGSLRNPSPRPGGYLGGLRERSEDELRRASREALEEALKEEWAVRDRVQYCSITWNKLEERDELLERMRARVREAEKQARESHRRYTEQEKSFDAERQALHAQEQHLQQRLISLPVPRSTPTEASSALQEEVASLTVTQSTLLTQLNTLTTEIHDLKILNSRLQEENEGWEYLVRERTISGQVRREGGLLGRTRQDAEEFYLSPTKHTTELENLDEQLEMEELHSDIEAHTPMQGREFDFDQPSPGGYLAPPQNTRNPKGESLGDVPVTGSGLDLAAELGRADVNLPGADMRILGKGDEGEGRYSSRKTADGSSSHGSQESTRSQQSSDAILLERFEHILSVDYKTRRLGRSASAQTRSNLMDVTTAFKTTEPEWTEKEENETRLKIRPFSIARVPSDTAEKEKVEAKTEKRARRGFSLDFRSLGFGSSPVASVPEPITQPGLKPLTLASRSSPAVPPRPLGRKLDPHEEDEDDKRERHRMEATLKLMGVERPSPSTGASDAMPSLNYWTGRPVVARRTSTPLSRMSSALGTLSSRLDTTSGLEMDDETTAAALKEFDDREKEQAKRLSEGKNEKGYTSPGSIVKKDKKDTGRGRGESVSTLWSMGGTTSRPGSGEMN